VSEEEEDTFESMPRHNSQDDYRFMRFLNKLVWASIPVLFTLLGATGKQVLDNDKRLTVIESNRYSRDAGNAEREERINGDAELRALILSTLYSIEKRLDRVEVLNERHKDK